MPDTLGFHHVALSVSDRDASSEWYTSVLGFEEVFRNDGDERRMCVMQFSGAPFYLGLVEHLASEDKPFDPSRHGLDGLAFAVGSREELEAWAARLTSAGADHEGVTETPPGAVLNFKDPDGIALAIFWDRD